MGWTIQIFIYIFYQYSIVISLIHLMVIMCTASVAQWLERSAVNREVVGSKNFSLKRKVSSKETFKVSSNNPDPRRTFFINWLIIMFFHYVYIC